MDEVKDVRVVKKDISRLRAEVRTLKKDFTDSKINAKAINPFTGLVSGNYWSQTGMPWVSSEGRKAVLTEWFWQPIRGQPRRIDTNELRQFASTFWVHSCITTILDELSAIDWDIVPKDGYDYDKVEVRLNEVKSFLEHPNKNRESFNEVFIRAMVKDLLEIDAGVLVKVFSVDSYDFDQLEPKSGSPLLKPRGQRKMLEIYARDGASFLKETDKFGFEQGYWQYSFQIPAHPMWFGKEEISYILRNNRSMSTYGYAPTQAILDVIKSLHYSTLYNKRFFEETPIPDGALGLLDTSEAEMKNFINWWDTEFKGQPHKLAVINKDIKWQPFNMTQRELEFLETQKWYYRLVIAMYGLTPAELGLTEDLNRATSSTQAELSKRKGIRPLLKILEDFINEDIISEFGYEGIEFQFIFDDPSEREKKLGNWKVELDMGLKTVNEVRNEMGLEPVSWGDMPNTRMGMLGMMGQQGPPGQDTAAGPPGQAMDPEEENEDPNDKKVEEAEGNQESAAVQEADGEDKKRRDEAEQETNKEVLDPYNLGRRPVGSFRSAKPKMTKNPLIVNEETRQAKADKLFIACIQEGKDETTCKKIAEEALREADDIIKKKLNNQEKFNDQPGQYYSEPLEVIKPNRGEIVQPQVAQYQDANIVEQPRGLINQENYNNFLYTSQNQFIDQSLVDVINCPRCGNPTLAYFNDVGDIGNMPKYRCTYCAAVLDLFELLDNQTMMTMFNTMQQNPSSQPITLPDWSPKNAKFGKSDLEMTTKEFCGFDYMKFSPDIANFTGSMDYRSILSGFLGDLSKRDLETVITILGQGIRQNLTIREIAGNVDKVIKDPARSERIARTEVIRITNEGNRQRMISTGFKEVEWVSAPEDGRLCPICRALDGKTFPIEEAKDKVPAHPGCRCSLAAVF